MYTAAQALAWVVCAQMLHTPFLCLLIMHFFTAPKQQLIWCRQLVKAVLSQAEKISPSALLCDTSLLFVQV